jgi:hypothetical protein
MWRVFIFLGLYNDGLSHISLCYVKQQIKGSVLLVVWGTVITKKSN